MTTLERPVSGSVLVDLMKRLESEERLDSVIARVGPVVDRVIASPATRDALQGRWLGHALHPFLTDLPLGLWTSTNVLDLLPVPGSRRSAEKLLALGILSAPAVFVTGWAEWRDTEAREQRVGLTHAFLNASGLGLYGLSLVARRRDRHTAGVLLALAGSTMVSAAGYLGGHLSAVRKVSSRNPEFDADTGDAARRTEHLQPS